MTEASKERRLQRGGSRMTAPPLSLRRPRRCNPPGSLSRFGASSKRNGLDCTLFHGSVHRTNAKNPSWGLCRDEYIRAFVLSPSAFQFGMARILVLATPSPEATSRKGVLEHSPRACVPETPLDPKTKRNVHKNESDAHPTNRPPSHDCASHDVSATETKRHHSLPRLPLRPKLHNTHTHGHAEPGHLREAAGKGEDATRGGRDLRGPSCALEGEVAGVVVRETEGET